ncbi:Denticleless protein [Fasciola hepatica]|uniref:Denticleless protein n=1 Tax=Fasciola hepatica TaxID=6192 RepID=A0A4E0R8S6_FASHE|nr:Denticleless protein [Fasciola hepatica]
MSVRCLSLMPSDTQIFASASRDGSIRIWDIRLKSDTVNFRGTPGTSSVGLLSQCHLPDWSAQATVENPITRRPRTPRRQLTDAQSVTSVLFKNENTLLSAGSTDGSIKMWDLRRIFSIASKKKAKPKFILPYRGVSQKRSGYSDLQLNSVHSRLYANCLDNVVYEYDLLRNSTSPVFAYTGHQTDSFYIKLDVSPDDRYVICGSSDRRAHIYAIGQRRQCPIVLSGHNGEVSVPRWCRSDPTRIVTLSDDSRAFVWNMFPARRCILPQPGELAGLAERLSPSEGLMSPGEQDRRIVRSPRSTPSRSTQQAVASALATTTSPSAASARRRQSNINCFLSALSPPCSSPQQGTKQGPTVPPAGCIGQLGRRNAATLTETLGGVVQRFPGLCVASTTTSGNSTPPLGCYSPTANVRSPSTPVSAHHRRLLSPDRLYSDASDIENISPSISRQPLLRDNLPLDCVDGPLGLTRSPILCCSTNTHMVPSTPETPPPTSLVKRTPLGLHQALFNTPPPPQQLLDENSHSVVVPRKRPSMFLDSAPEVRDPDRMLLGKRRRLTVYEPIDRRAGAPVSHSPTTPIGRRRRMTTCTTRALTPITKFFKRNGDDKI